MKKNIFDPGVKEEVFTRIQQLSNDTRPRWGKLNAAQMARHLNEACRIAFGEVKVPDQSNFLSRTLVKWLFLANVKPPGREKGNIKTFPQVDIVQLGIPVETVDKEINAYETTVNRLFDVKDLNPRHPIFGKMSRQDWGLLTYAHADYHLTQFNL